MTDSEKITKWLMEQSGRNEAEFSREFTVKIENTDKYGAAYKVTTIYNVTNAMFVDWFTSDCEAL